MIVRQAHITDLELIVPLFDQYRVFYGQASDLNRAKVFLEARFQHKESIIFVAFKEYIPVGFLQLYFSFSSVSLESTLILNDIYVNRNYRNLGVGSSLLKNAQEYCRKNQYKGLALETATDNPAQKLYEKLGWTRDSHCFHYFWPAK
ncbi:GNAT family N-acetyltransferase [Maribacter algicola]|uniref:GNAT family N-acetyltransferase n=1 Tax=Maribacter algicola TaxID=2498892 RepID=A0A426RH52_9FLAO|nr:GNAT family N-acetyltransferase [Maribacter algicola]RRQ48266.1 GNAT family N-acetyltransferase [Maribacter algicola]